LDELIQLQARMVALEEQRQAQTERLLANVMNRQVQIERHVPVDRPLPSIANLPEPSISFGQAPQTQDVFRELGMRQYLATFPQITPQIHRGGPEPAQSGQAVHYHVHLPSRGIQQPFDLADLFRGFPPGGRYY
jgi:hypothetical protein